MKAIRIHQTGGPEVMKLEEVPDPKPGPKQVVVRVHAVGVNPVDAYRRAGTYPGVTLPYTPGSDAAGEILAAGKEVQKFSIKDRVYTSGALTGAYAEQALCNEDQVHPLPSKVSFEQGAGVNIPYATAYRALFQKAKTRPGEWVLVHGASGGVGIAAVQLARAAGIMVIGTAGTSRGMVLASEQGAHVVLNHRNLDYLDEMIKKTGGRKPHVILEMLSNVNLEKDLEAIAMGGRIVVIGSRGRIEIDPRLAMRNEATLLGMVLFNAKPHELASIHEALGAGLANGTLNPIIGQALPLQEAPAAHKRVLEPGSYGKIVLIP